MPLLRDERWPVARLIPITSATGIEAKERNPVQGGAMTTVSFGPWTLDVDLDATRDIYAKIPDGSEACACDHCQDWARQRTDTVPLEVQDILSGLGVDWRREAEVYEANPAPSPAHFCAGWFHVIGQIVDGPRHHYRPFDKDSGEIVMPDPIGIVDRFEAYVHDDYRPMKPAMEAAWKEGHPVFAFEFHTWRHVWGGGEAS